MNEYYDLEFESAVIGSILFNPDLLSDISEVIGYDDFYLPDNKNIFRAMLTLQAKNEAIDERFIKKELGEKFNQTVLDEAANNSVVNAVRYAKVIKELSQKRKIYALANKIPTIIQNNNTNQILDELSAQLYAISSAENQTIRQTGYEAAREALNEIFLRKKEGNGLLGINTGYASLNHYTNGFKKGDFVIIAARPGMGKTTFALNIVEKVLENGQGVVFFSLEMPAQQLMFRLFSSLSNIDYGKILKGVTLDDKDLELLSQACERIANYNFFIYDSGDVTVHKIRTELRKLKEKHPNIELCVIDYIGLMTNSSNFNERHLQIAEISRSLKLLARELQIPIIALSQLNRGVESRANKRPQLSDLRESGAIEQDADLILFVYRSDYYKEQESKELIEKEKALGKAIEQKAFVEPDMAAAEIIIGKNRNGATGVMNMIFDKKHSRFAGADEQEHFEEKETIIEFNS